MLVVLPWSAVGARVLCRARQSAHAHRYNPAMIDIRAARADDQAEIRRLVLEARLDPSWLDWRHFNVAETNGEVVGVAQIKPHPDCREFGSFVVSREHRGHGVGAHLLESTLSGEHGEVFLICRDALAGYYAKFGFRTVAPSQAPRTLRRKIDFARVFRIFGVRVICMRRPPQPEAV
jgi:amino-acid N-acetyltransferase